MTTEADAQLMKHERRKTLLLKIGGLVWVFLGAGNLFATPWRVVDNAGTLEGLPLNCLLFFLPGIFLYSRAEMSELKHQTETH
jgi:hypothetical protein